MNKNIEDNYLLFKNLPISYMGGKKKIFKKIAPILIEVFDETDIILDGFSGSGIISAFLSQYVKQVFSNDILYSAYALTTMLSQNPGETISIEEKNFLSKHRCVDGFIFEDDEIVDYKIDISLYKDYPGVLTKNEMIWILYLLEKSKDLSPYKKIIVDCAIRGISTIIPFNSAIGNQKLKNRIKQKDKYGDRCLGYYYNSSYEIEYVKWFHNYIDKFNDAILFLGQKRINDAICYNTDIIELLNNKKNFNAAYFDIPYGYETSISYLSRYAFQEKLLGHELPQNYLKLQGINYNDSFIHLITSCNDINRIILSYDSKSWYQIEEITNILKQYGRKKINVISIEHTHGMSGIKRANNNVNEYIIVADN